MKYYSIFFALPLLLLTDAPVLASVGWPGAVLLVLTLLLGGAQRGFSQIYINSYQFVTSAFPLWNKDPYTTTDINNTLTEITALSSTQSLDVSTFGNLTGSSKWYGGVLAPNGKIYAIPFNSTSILEIDPSVTPATTATFGNLTGSSKWLGGVLAPNGKIYAIPFNSTSILEIDPSVTPATTATFGNLTGTSKWYGGVLAPNGKIYGIPISSTSILEIDPSVTPATTATFGNLTGVSKWAGGVLAPNGKIYGIPVESTSILEILSTFSVNTNFPLSRLFNKL